MYGPFLSMFDGGMDWMLDYVIDCFCCPWRRWQVAELLENFCPYLDEGPTEVLELTISGVGITKRKPLS